ncbi:MULTISPECIES: LamG domain-containing protein [Catenuloplanes]|uniref:LamG-like jellyroll fold domain-containing protein n=1 Tax=Catenuloplanes niger TaxID=587534 RepID=A0AAE3ZJW1_9ACTN|nr:LamG domain-containing protein [Catenuloplanes niger]MDR7320046.1 hypothetical protein [Catenuloplanes niger]
MVGLTLHPVLPQAAEAARPLSEAERAADTGERVEVLSERTEYSQVFAEPSGRFVMESTVVPKHVRHADGSWSETDLDLSVRPDGTVRPGASIADVRFSGGGDAPMVTLVDAGKTLTLSWPGDLPVPEVSGDSATYRGVLDGVDLVLRATWTGFTHVLVVNTPEAVESVRSVTIDVGGDASVSALPDGGLRAVAGRTVLATADAPTMWDSAAPPLGLMARMATSGVPSSPAGPGDASNTAAVRTEVTGQGDLRLIPDAGMLGAPEQHFPLFIDPAWDKKAARWAYATNNQADNYSDRARVGWNPGSEKLHRSFFKFMTTDLAGKYVHSARVQMNLDHSWSCDFTPTSMWVSDAINGAQKNGDRVTWWTILRTGLVAASSHANDAGGCGQNRHDMIVQFDNAAVKNQVQSFASARKTDITFGFCACDLSGAMEGYAVRWKTFIADDARLIVEYDSIPGTPERLMVEPNTDCSVPISTGTLTPRLYARLPDADTTQKLTATFQWKQIPAAGQVNDGTFPVSTSTVSNQSANAQSSPVQVTIQNGKRYAFRVQTKDPAPYNQSSPWSGWCEFYPDTSVPAEPSVTRTSGVPGPGGEAAFTISTPSLDVTKFRYGWKNPPDKEITATLTTAADGSKSMTASVKLSTVKYGENIFTAYGIDNTLNNGRATSVSLIVNAPRGPIADFGLQAYPGVDQATALQNSAAAGGGALATTDLTWTDDVRILGGKTATFTGTATQGAVATGVALDTTKSYSVAAWVRLTDLTVTSTAIAKEAPAGVSSPFRLRARPLTAGNSWCLLIPSTTTTVGTEVCSNRLNTVNQWTHVAAGYDSADKRIKVWVDGVETSAGFSAPTTNTNPIVIGRGQDAASTGFVERFRGNIADVQIFDRLLVPDDFTGATAVRTDDGEVDEPGILDPVEVGLWRFDRGVPCGDESNARLCNVPADDDFQRELRTTLGTMIDYGRDGSSMFLDATLVDGSTPNPKREYGQSRQSTGTAAEYTPVLRTDQSFTVSAWADPDALGTGVRTVVSQDGPDRTPFVLSLRTETVNGVAVDRWAFSRLPSSGDGADAVRSTAAVTAEDTAGWTHLVGVYDAERKQVRLYVNGVLQGSTTANMPAWQASGPLTVGGALFNGQRTDAWHGGIDDVHTYQGALNDAHVRALFLREQTTPVD